jgi:hypothetical protein
MGAVWATMLSSGLVITGPPRPAGARRERKGAARLAGAREVHESNGLSVSSLGALVNFRMVRRYGARFRKRV